ENPVGEEAHGTNSYFEAFAGIAAALDALAKAVTPDEEDDGTPADEGERPSCNSYFASFRNIIDALGRLKAATEERLVALSEKDPNFAAWKEAYSIGLGKGASPASNGIAIGWNATAGSGTGTGARDSGAVAVGKAASALGIDAVAIGRGAVAGASGNRTTQATVQLGSGTNTADGTLQFRSWQLVNAEGKIPAERLPEMGGMAFVTPTASGGTATLVNKAVNAVALDGTAVAFAFPAAVAGQGRAFIVRLVCTAETAWTLPSGVTFESDDEEVFADVDVGETVALLFSEVAEGRFLVSRKTVKTVSRE
ncbi:MAG: hypothetical protein IJI54_01500, partial [Kiritimatiellae bacterium]|nr:hypothetical protein [Kiritimatiellia bacterium]